jgi:capsular polysaccharide biosynthesis protein
VTDRVFSLNGGNGEREQLGVYDDFAATGNPPADFVPGLINLGFIKAALWRSAWFVACLAAVGLLGGLTYYVKFPKAYHASASLLITLSPYENDQTATANNQAMAMTTSVATLAMRKLGIHQTTSSFLNTYSISSATSRVMTITAAGPSAADALVRASAVANAFLTFRGDELRAQQDLVLASLNQQADQAKQRVDSLDAQIGQLSGQAGSTTQQAQLDKLRTQRTNAENALSSLQQAVAGNQSTTLPTLTAAIKNSQVLSVTSIPYPVKRTLVTYVALGLIGGLAVALGIVIIRALVSDRLRRRDDVAYALDAPVKLSVHTLRSRRRLVPWPGRGAKRDRDMKRVIAHLRSAVPRRTHGAQGLAIVAVDTAPVVARAVTELASSFAGIGTPVIAADLSSGAHLAHLSGVKRPGVHAVSHNGSTFTMAVPERDDLAPVGPLPPFNSPPGGARGLDPLVSSDGTHLLLTLATLDPAVGADHLATWASDAVVVVSAGESSAERIHSVGEMIRLAGLRLDSVVLLGADKADESLGLTPRPDEQVGVGVLGR